MSSPTGLSKLASLLHVNQDDLRECIEQVVDERESRRSEQDALNAADAYDSCFDNYGSAPE